MCHLLEFPVSIIEQLTYSNERRAATAHAILYKGYMIYSLF